MTWRGMGARKSRVARLMGATMTLLGAGPWTVRGAPDEPAQFLAQLVLSVILLCLGAAALHSGNGCGEERGRLDRVT